MANQPVPFLDLVTPHRELEAELLQVVQKALRTASFIGGPMVEEFEQAFADFCGTSYCVGVNSGTDALRFALIAAGIGPGDSVITVPNTFIATVEAISQAGATPEFVDIDERTYNMDPVKLAEFLEQRCELRNYQNGGHPERSEGSAVCLFSRRTGKRVAGVIPVHLYGQMADMDPILALAEKYNLVVIEDACQAHGAEYFSKRQNRWCKAGSMGQAAAFSFYPGKNLGACGEAGAITTNDEGLARIARMLRDHGQAKRYYHDMEGYNGRLDAIQAGFLKVKLTHLPAWNAARRGAAARYRELFSHPTGNLKLETGNSQLVILPYEPDWARSIYHLFVVRVSDREGLTKQLAAENIGFGIHYPIPLHLQKAYAALNYGAEDFPITENTARAIVSLPMFPTLTAETQARVADSIFRFAKDAISVAAKDKEMAAAN
jgi:dTDP-4-amino-4,6-dideoxygalactose transaminase